MKNIKPMFGEDLKENVAKLGEHLKGEENLHEHLKGLHQHGLKRLEGKY